MRKIKHVTALLLLLQVTANVTVGDLADEAAEAAVLAQQKAAITKDAPATTTPVMPVLPRVPMPPPPPANVQVGPGPGAGQPVPVMQVQTPPPPAAPGAKL